jgi:hypothetical protein
LVRTLSSREIRGEESGGLGASLPQLRFHVKEKVKSCQSFLEMSPSLTD